jgi:hypothetical protein
MKMLIVISCCLLLLAGCVPARWVGCTERDSGGNGWSYCK